MISLRQEALWGWENTGPVWGARAFTPKSGQDHLGLGSVSSDRILPRLSPGINVLTIHPRYWSFYSWVLDCFWSTSLPRTRNAFRDFYRPREAIFSMACHLCDAPEHETLVSNIVGSRRISPQTHIPEFDPQFDYIKEPLGGYGLYYRSTMELTGVLILAGPENGFPFDAPTPAGRALAAAFQEAISGTHLSSVFAAGSLASTVSQDSLIEFARKACLCQLRKAESYDLPLLQDLFLHSGQSEEAGSRSQTLRMLLDLSSCHSSEAIGQDEFRQLIYFREIGDSHYVAAPELVDVARRWRAYQGREYFAYVFNRLLRWVSRLGRAETDDGLTLLPAAELWDLVARTLDNSAQDQRLGLALPAVTASTPTSELLEHLRAGVEVEPSANELWPRRGDLDEHALYRACSDDDTEDGNTLVALLSLLLLLRERFGLPERTYEYVEDQGLLSEGGNRRIGMSHFMHLLNQRMLADPSIAGLAQWLIEDFIVIQHARVAAAKLPDDTYRIRRVGHALEFIAQEAPAGFNDSRFGALSTMIHELGWVSTFREPNRQLTTAGQSLLAGGDRTAGALEKAALPYAQEERL